MATQLPEDLRFRIEGLFWDLAISRKLRDVALAARNFDVANRRAKVVTALEHEAREILDMLESLK